MTAYQARNSGRGNRTLINPKKISKTFENANNVLVVRYNSKLQYNHFPLPRKYQLVRSNSLIH